MGWAKTMGMIQGSSTSGGSMKVQKGSQTAEEVWEADPGAAHLLGFLCCSTLPEVHTPGVMAALWVE